MVAVSLVAVRPLGVAGVVSPVAGQLVISVLAAGTVRNSEVELTPGRLASVLLVAVGRLLITRL